MKIAGSGSGSLSQRHGSADPRIMIRIHTKMSWIRNTGSTVCKLYKIKIKNFNVYPFRAASYVRTMPSLYLIMSVDGGDVAIIALAVHVIGRRTR
jgi:hypothetical protein